jgi:hypothetical protein
MSDALTRITGVFNATNSIAAATGKTVEEAFGAVGLASYDARKKMIDLAGGIQGAANILNALTTAQDAYNTAVTAAKSAMSTAASQYKVFVDAVSTAEIDLASARTAIADQYRSAIEAETAAKSDVADEQRKLTAGYIAASEKVAEAQRKVVDTFRKLGAELSDFLGSFDMTDIAGASIQDQYAASQARLAVVAAQVKAGDTSASSQIPAIAKAIIELGSQNSATKEDFALIVAGVRATVSDVAAFADSKVAAATPANDPNVIQLDALAAALEEQKKWAAAVMISGSSFTTSSESILDGYNTAVAAQVEAASSVAYFASVAESTGTNITETGTALTRLGDELLTGFFTAKTALELAQIDLVAANAIKGGLELRQTTALENFVGAIVNVNTTARVALDAAGALFLAASNQLLAGSDASNRAMLEAKGGMTYWGGVVTMTAKGIADSVAALAAANASAATVAAANAAAQQVAASAASEAAMRNTAFIEGIYNNVLGRASDASGLAFWVGKLTTGAITAANAAVEIAKGGAAQSENLSGAHAPDWTLALAMADDLKGTAYLKSLNIPGFDVGTNYVSNDMLAMVHRGEEITPRPFVDLQRAARDETNSLLDRLVASNAELRAELAEIRKSVSDTATNTNSTAINTQRHTELAEQVVFGDLSYQTREAGTDV